MFIFLLKHEDKHAHIHCDWVVTLTKQIVYLVQLFVELFRYACEQSTLVDYTDQIYWTEDKWLQIKSLAVPNTSDEFCK